MNTVTIERLRAARVLCVASLAFALAITASPVSAAALLPTAGTGIRDFGGGPFLLDFLAVKKVTEDRAALEFDLTGLTGPISSAPLDFGIKDIDPDDGEGVLDIFTYVGNGAIEPTDFFAGVFFNGFDLDQVNGLVHLDVTGPVNSAIAGEAPFLGFRLSTVEFSRFDIGSSSGIGLSDPTLTVVPEPSGIVLTGVGVIVGGVFAQRRSRNALLSSVTALRKARCHLVRLYSFSPRIRLRTRTTASPCFGFQSEVTPTISG
jgi:hypothetical protein